MKKRTFVVTLAALVTCISITPVAASNAKKQGGAEKVKSEKKFEYCADFVDANDDDICDICNTEVKRVKEQKPEKQKVEKQKAEKQKVDKPAKEKEKDSKQPSDKGQEKVKKEKKEKKAKATEN